MEFRLTYDGLLPAASQSNSRTTDKRRIREFLHPQLKRLWAVHPLLKDKKADGPGIEPEPMADVLAKIFTRGNYHFVPLVSKRLNLACKISVLMLRPDTPGAPLVSSGDIDNRIKVLFDALSVPHAQDRIGNDLPNEDEKPFYCLLEDDSLINHIDVETDLLLQDCDGQYQNNVVRLIITVNLKPTIATWENIGF